MTQLFFTLKSIIAFGILLAPASNFASTSPHVVNFGYNKFVPNSYSESLPTTLDSDEGIAIFEHSKCKKAFFKLSPHFSPQAHINSCGIASAVIILNTVYATSDKAFPLSKKGSWYVPEENTLYGQFLWTEDNFYNKKVAHLIDRRVVEGKKKIDGQYQPGVTLNQLTLALKRQGLKVKAYHVEDTERSSIDQFRRLVKKLTANPTHYIIANYNLNVYLSDSGGHFSPLAAYEDVSDSILILDTWSAANTWVWVKLVDLYQSMNTLDGIHYRGFILVNAISE